MSLATRRIAIVGAQFGDPGLFVRWIDQSFDVSWRYEQVGEHDRVHEALVNGPTPVRVEAAVPAHFEADKVYDYIFREAPDAVLLVLTAMQTVPRDVNAMAMGWARPHLTRLGITPVVLVNDAHGRNPEFPTFSGARVKKEHDVPWAVRETMIGNWRDARSVRWHEGADEAWRLLLGGQ